MEFRVATIWEKNLSIYRVMRDNLTNVFLQNWKLFQDSIAANKMPLNNLLYLLFINYET